MPTTKPTLQSVADQVFESARTRLDLRELADQDDPLGDEDLWDVLLTVCEAAVIPFIKQEVVTVGDLSGYSGSDTTVASAVHMYLVDNVADLVKRQLPRHAFD